MNEEYEGCPEIQSLSDLKKKIEDILANVTYEVFTLALNEYEFEN